MGDNTNAEHGYDFQETVYRALLSLKAEGYLVQVIKNFRIGQPGFLNNEQYYSPFLIQFNDRIRWILFTTTSMRTDRVKGQQWDSDRIRDVDGMISKSYLVYPDDLSTKETQAFVAQRRKYMTKFEYSRIDDIVPMRMLLAQIREKDDEILIENNGKKIQGSGRVLDFSGRNFERSIAAILSSHVYLETFRLHRNNGEDTYKKFCKLMIGLSIDACSVERIRATAEKDEIGLLPSGGSPKTDVIVMLENKDGTEGWRSITCKRSTKPWVSVHQYKADAFADVIDKDNEHLRMLLNMFQACPVQGEYPKNCERDLAVELGKNIDRFCRWVIGGHGGSGTPKQNADYIVTYNSEKNDMAVHSLDDYIHIIRSRRRGFAGTPFQWTFASKQRGKDIQLKVPMVFD